MTVIWFSSGFKSAAFGYIALPITYLLRHICETRFCCVEHIGGDDFAVDLFQMILYRFILCSFDLLY